MRRCGRALRRGRPPRGRGRLVRPSLRAPLAAFAGALVACSVASPATEVRETLAREAPRELALPAGGGRIELARATFGDVAVSMDGARALVVAIVEADGRVRTGPREVRLAYVGREAFVMERCAARRWCPAGAALPSLQAVVEVVRAAPRPDGRRPLGWQIRVERERAVAGEDAELEDGARVRGVFELRRAGEAWRVASGP